MDPGPEDRVGGGDTTTTHTASSDTNTPGILVPYLSPAHYLPAMSSTNEKLKTLNYQHKGLVEFEAFSTDFLAALGAHPDKLDLHFTLYQRVCDRSEVSPRESA